MTGETKAKDTDGYDVPALMGSHYKSTRLHLRYTADIAATFNAKLQARRRGRLGRGGAGVSLRFEAGGGVPPQSHEVLRIDPGGDGRYLTGMPWPSQRPFDEIGVYVGRRRTSSGCPSSRRRSSPRRPPRGGHADAGGESIELDGAVGELGSARPEAGGQALVDAARAAITAAREQPARRRPRRGRGRRARRSGNRGERPLAVAAGEVHVGWGTARAPAVPAPARRRRTRRRSRCRARSRRAGRSSCRAARAAAGRG